jgi:phosphoglucomutase/phosphomannomutase
MSNSFCKRLIDTYGDQGRGAAERLELWLSGKIPFAFPEILEKLVADESRLALVFDEFWQTLPFGTGGRRGRVGYGSNRMNPANAAMTVQGHCQYLRRVFPDRRDLAVVVANDVREFHDIAGVYAFLGKTHPAIGVSSRSLAKLACEIYTGNGITAYLAQPRSDSAVLTTPELSFLIRRLGAVGGVNLSASHNPPDDNGIKVYDLHGSQPIAPNDQVLADAMENAMTLSRLPFEEALGKGLILETPRALHADYIHVYTSLYGRCHTPDPGLPIVYTPLCGCGLTTVGDVLHALEFPVLVPPDQRPDGTFAVIPMKAPNPEVPEATGPARAFADRHGADIVLSSDPDADRVGLEIKLPSGAWRHFDGNEIATVLAYFLMLDPQGPRRRGLVIETVVTTKILKGIVERAGESWLIDDLLVGFKYVADVLNTFDQGKPYRGIRCSPGQLVLAAEESHGVIMAPDIRDKDASPACMYLAALYQMLARKGLTMLDYYVRIVRELGGYDNVNRAIMMRGAEGEARKNRMMAALRSAPPKMLGGQTVRKMVDYWDAAAFGPFVSETDKLPRNVIAFFADSFIITIRPSGTEPKLKFYCQLLPGGEPVTSTGAEGLLELRAQADAVSRRVYNELLALADLSLGEAALFLPDIVELGCKVEFDQVTIPKLHDKLVQNRFATLDDLLAWLRQEVAAMTPGADPLPVLKAPVAHLCGQWRGEGTVAAARLDELAAWAAG